MQKEQKEERWKKTPDVKVVLSARRSSKEERERQQTKKKKCFSSSSHTKKVVLPPPPRKINCEVPLLFPSFAIEAEILCMQVTNEATALRR